MALPDPVPPERRERNVRLVGRVLDRRGRMVVGGRHLLRAEQWKLDRIEVSTLVRDLNEAGRRVEAERLEAGLWELRLWDRQAGEPVT